MVKKRTAQFINPIISLTNGLISFFMFIGMLGLVTFVGYKVWGIAMGAIALQFGSMLHDIALLVVLVKAYRILLYYYREHHVSIKYIVEISIIAPAIELIFAPTEQTLFVNILFAAFSLVNLLIYLLFFEKLAKADMEECKESHAIDKGTIT